MSRFSVEDSKMMAKAIQLAKKGRFTTSPNPNVGCVIVDAGGNIVGQGYHQKAGEPHAEIFALRQAGERAKGATAYVTLEPCSHHGRTPPCALALIDAGIVKVVAAMVDPNPDVAGKGLALLAANGVEVSHGLMEEQAKKLNRGFIQRMLTGKPWVTLKMAASLDGKTALQNGLSQWITSKPARQDVQRHRAQSCAILSGSGTVLADDPSLNVRYDELGYVKKYIDKAQLRQPMRIILDGRNQLIEQHKMFLLQGQTYVINKQHNDRLPENVIQIQVSSKGNKLDLNETMTEIGRLGVNELWVEAGGMMAGALLENNLIDELILYQAPKLLGDKGQNLFVMTEKTTMEQANLFHWGEVKQVGADLKMTAVLKQPN